MKYNIFRVFGRNGGDIRYTDDEGRYIYKMNINDRCICGHRGGSHIHSPKRACGFKRCNCRRLKKKSFESIIERLVSGD